MDDGLDAVRARFDEAGGWRPVVGVGPGWNPIVACLVNDLIAIHPDLRLHQVKAKIGGLSVYIEPIADPVLTAAVQARVRQAEQQASTVCEECGEPGHGRSDLSYAILCDSDYSLLLSDRVNDNADDELS